MDTRCLFGNRNGSVSTSRRHTVPVSRVKSPPSLKRGTLPLVAGRTVRLWLCGLALARGTTMPRGWNWQMRSFKACPAIRICCSDGRCSSRGLNGLFSDAWDALTGKPQSWYTNVSNLQNQLSVLLAGVTAVTISTT
jgi:hypothetical protein